MTNFLDDIENKKSNIDLGRMAAQVLTGAVEESGSLYRGWLATCAFFVGMFSKKPEDNDEGQT